MSTPANPADLITWLRAQLDADERVAKAWLPFGNPTAADREHIARHDPARVLAEVDAKRRILDEAERVEAKAREALNGEDSGLALVLQGERLAMERTVRMMARIFADRPGYREAGGEP